VVGSVLLFAAGCYVWNRIPVLQCPNCEKYLLEEDIELQVMGTNGEDREYATCPTCEYQWMLEKVAER